MIPCIKITNLELDWINWRKFWKKSTKKGYGWEALLKPHFKSGEWPPTCAFVPLPLYHFYFPSYIGG